MTTTQQPAEIRELCSLAELNEAEALQVAVWGEGDIPDNTDIMLAIQHEGGLLAGAFVDGRMLGFLFAFPTCDPRIQHSHRLAVHPDSQGLGLGGKLKWFQRDWCLERGIDLVRWTYDPLRRVNANLNIAKLGATADIYHEDYYGQMEGINAGVPSDRLVAEWHLNAKNVRSAKNKQPKLSDHPQTLRISIPFDFEMLIQTVPQEAIEKRLQIRKELTTAFADGLRITGFDAVNNQYLLT